MKGVEDGMSDEPKRGLKDVIEELCPGAYERNRLASRAVPVEERTPLPTREAVETALSIHDYPAKIIKAHLAALTEGERRILFRAVIDAAKPIPEERTAEMPSMSTGDAEPLREDTITFVYDGMEAVTHACGLLDVIKQEWEGMWTEHDQAVRDGLSRILSTSLYAKETEQTFDMQNPRLDHIEGKAK